MTREQGPAYDDQDLVGKSGAPRVVNRVRDVWSSIVPNATVDLSVKNAGFNPSVRSAHHDVRSDMRDGQPPIVKGFSLINGSWYAMLEDGTRVLVPKGALGGHKKSK